MNTRNIVKNIRSSAVIDGKPKLPTSGQLSEGEIAVNYAKGHETLSFKNNSNEIVSLSVKTVDDVTVNGKSVVSNKTANITMKGDTTPVANTYTTTTFPSPFNEGAEHISASDNVDVALKKVETNISKLVSEVVKVPSDAISKLANSAGTIDGSNNITYVKATNAHYISDATSVHNATVKLDSNLYNLDIYCQNLNNTVINLQTTIDRLQEITSSIPTMEFVDLDLPSGTLWAKCNIGATSESDYGDYFMWGSTTPNTNTTCNWAKAPFNNGASGYNENYFNQVKGTVCPNGVLAKGYDVAYKTTNGAARMPAQAEFQELLDNTTKEWTQVKSVNGWKFTSKTNTSKYIFIPASGYRSDSSFQFQNEEGLVWSSSLGDSNPSEAWYLYFSSGYCSVYSNYSRRYGLSVRAVRNLPL